MNGQSVSIGDVTEWSKENVVWNIFDSSEADSMFRGTIINTGAITGSIIFPEAVIEWIVFYCFNISYPSATSLSCHDKFIHKILID